MTAPGECTTHERPGYRKTGLPYSCGNADEGEGGCIFDEIDNLVEPAERPHMDVRAGAD
jgi:hypothetical protein